MYTPTIYPSKAVYNVAKFNPNFRVAFKNKIKINAAQI